MFVTAGLTASPSLHFATSLCQLSQALLSVIWMAFVGIPW